VDQNRMVVLACGVRGRTPDGRQLEHDAGRPAPKGALFYAWVCFDHRGVWGVALAAGQQAYNLLGGKCRAMRLGDMHKRP
jgi:hypothetical protein